MVTHTCDICGGNKLVDKYAYSFGVKEEFTLELCTYCEYKMNIANEKFSKLIVTAYKKIFYPILKNRKNTDIDIRPDDEIYDT